MAFFFHKSQGEHYFVTNFYCWKFIFSTSKKAEIGSRDIYCQSSHLMDGDFTVMINGLILLMEEIWRGQPPFGCIKKNLLWKNSESYATFLNWCRIFLEISSKVKLYPWKWAIPKGNFIFQPSIFRCYVSFREGSFFFGLLKPVKFTPPTAIEIETPFSVAEWFDSLFQICSF